MSAVERPTDGPDSGWTKAEGAAAVKRERELVASTGNDGRRVVPGSVEIAADGLLTWAEKCRPRCKHPDGICAVSRCSLPPYVSYADQLAAEAEESR